MNFTVAVVTATKGYSTSKKQVVYLEIQRQGMVHTPGDFSVMRHFDIMPLCQLWIIMCKIIWSVCGFKYTYGVMFDKTGRVHSLHLMGDCKYCLIN